MTHDYWKDEYIKNKVGNNIELYTKIKQLSQTQQLSTIFREKYFWKDKFYTTKYTLDPRPDTEMILDIICNKYKNNTQSLRILELGVGTGAVIISILKEFPHWKGVGIDISHKALKVATYNMRQHNIQNLVLKHNNWLENINDHYDILISNPPYLQPHEYHLGLNMDPKLALIEPSDLYFYHKIAEKIHLFKHVICEINCLRNMNDYLQLFKISQSKIHYNINNIPMILEYVII